MDRLRRHRRSFAGLALVVMLAFTLLGAFGRAGAATPAAAGWSEVCTSHGVQRVVLDTAGEPLPATQAAFDHCPLCTLPGPAAAPPPALSALPLPAAAAVGPPAGDAPAAAMRPPQRAHARAPPPFA